MAIPYWSPSVHTCFIQSSLALNVLPTYCSVVDTGSVLVCYVITSAHLWLHSPACLTHLRPSSLPAGPQSILPHSPNLQSSTCSAICNARPSTIHSISTPAAIRSLCQPGLNSCLWVTKMSLTLTEWGGMGVQHVHLWFARFGYTKINFTAILKTAATNICQQMFMFLSRRLLIHEGFFYQSLNCSWESPLFMFEFETVTEMSLLIL